MKTRNDIHYAHDLLAAFVNGSAPLPDFIAVGGKEALAMLRAMLIVLCWVLGHPNGDLFQTFAEGLEEYIRLIGYSLHKPSAKPGTHPPEQSADATRKFSIN